MPGAPVSLIKHHKVNGDKMGAKIESCFDGDQIPRLLETAASCIQKIKMQRETTSAMSPWTDGGQPGACRDCTLIRKRVNDPAIKHTEMVSRRLHRAGVSAVRVIYCRCGLRQQVSCERF